MEVDKIGKKKTILIGNKIDLADSIIIKEERMNDILLIKKE